MRSQKSAPVSFVGLLAGLFALVGFFLNVSLRRKSSIEIGTESFAEYADYSEFTRENVFANRVVKRAKLVADKTVALYLCSDCGKPHLSSKRIIALIEMRNVRQSLYGFLRSLEPVVDGIVLLDDHSTDGSRADVFEMCHIRGQRACKVDAVLNKTGSWVREELRDRELLLETGRAIGGTHFVLLDYDEYFSANCVNSGLLRQRIYQLEPGQSLFVPWVEMWKSVHLHRVLPTDRAMNFLTRRQTVIFADDGVVKFSMNSANARRLGARSGSIHALRCPRTICPRPPKYRGAQTEMQGDSRVKFLPPQCKLIEMRFMHLPNILLKSAWYQALGRIMGAEESSTRGKMLDVLFPAESSHAHGSQGQYLGQSRSSKVSLQLVREEWLTERNRFDGASSRRVEFWRAEEFVHWLDVLGDSQFSNLSVAKVVDTRSLRWALALGSLLPNQDPVHVPRRKHGTLIVAIESDFAPCASEFLRTVGTSVHVTPFSSVRFEGSFELHKLHRDLHEGSSFEDWKFQLQKAVRTGISKSKSSVTFFSPANMSMDDFQSFLSVATNDLAELDVVFLFSMERGPNQSPRLQSAVQAATVPGSHVRVVVMAPSAYGSYSALSWLRWRLTGTHSTTVTESEGLLSLAEGFHSKEWNNVIPDALPVSRIIFSLNAGRSGSKYLASILSSLGRGARGKHEPRCPDGKCSGGGAMAMQKLKLGDSYAERKALKIPMIRASIANILQDGAEAMLRIRAEGYGHCTGIFNDSPKESHRIVYEAGSEMGCMRGEIRDFVYGETNPNFKSWFYDVTLDNMPQMGYSISVIVLRKYVAAVLKSLFETGYFSSRNGYNWMETANGVNSKIRSIGPDDSLNAFDKIISYIFNSEAVTRAIMKKYGSTSNSRFPVKFVEVRSEEVYQKEGTMKLLRILGLSPGLSTETLAGVRDDKYGSGFKKRRLRRTSLRTCAARVSAYLAKCKELSIALPENMEHLTKWHGFQYAED